MAPVLHHHRAKIWERRHCLPHVHRVLQVEQARAPLPQAELLPQLPDPLRGEPEVPPDGQRARVVRAAQEQRPHAQLARHRLDGLQQAPPVPPVLLGRLRREERDLEVARPHPHRRGAHRPARRRQRGHRRQQPHRRRLALLLPVHRPRLAGAGRRGVRPRPGRPVPGHRHHRAEAREVELGLPPRPRALRRDRPVEVLVDGGHVLGPLLRRPRRRRALLPGLKRVEQERHLQPRDLRVLVVPELPQQVRPPHQLVRALRQVKQVYPHRVVGRPPRRVPRLRRVDARLGPRRVRRPRGRPGPRRPARRAPVPAPCSAPSCRRRRRRWTTSGRGVAGPRSVPFPHRSIGFAGPKPGPLAGGGLAPRPRVSTAVEAAAAAAVAVKRSGVLRGWFFLGCGRGGRETGEGTGTPHAALGDPTQLQAVPGRGHLFGFVTEAGPAGANRAPRRPAPLLNPALDFPAF